MNVKLGHLITKILKPPVSYDLSRQLSQLQVYLLTVFKCPKCLNRFLPMKVPVCTFNKKKTIGPSPGTVKLREA